MCLHYDEDKNKVIITIHSDREDILNDIAMLVEKKQLLKNSPDGLELEIHGILKLDANSERLTLTF